MGLLFLTFSALNDSFMCIILQKYEVLFFYEIIKTKWGKFSSQISIIALFILAHVVPVLSKTKILTYKNEASALIIYLSKIVYS